MSHVFVRVSGHGRSLLPHWPYRFARDADAVVVTRLTSHGEHHARIGPEDRTSLDGVVDILDGPSTPEWVIETTGFSCRWPHGFTIESTTDPADHVKFYLYGTGKGAIFPQGPTDDPPADWATPGQRIVDKFEVPGDIRVVELAYVHEGSDWWQSHWLVPYAGAKTLIITAQSPVAEAGPTREAAWIVAGSVISG